MCPGARGRRAERVIYIPMAASRYELASESMDWDSVESLAKNTLPLATNTQEEATQWFRSYADIHPFADGNGRTGSILYNWLRGSLPEPIHPPNVWTDPRVSIRSTRRRSCEQVGTASRGE